MAGIQREREDKFDVDMSFVMPALDDLVRDGRRVERATVNLESTYFDTADHTLLGQHVTLRRREGDIDTGWQLKVPDGKARTEIRLPPQGGDGVPAELSDLVAGLSLGRPLGPIAILRTQRRVQRLMSEDDLVVLEAADDLVHAAVLGGTAVICEWREVELELGTGTEKLLAKAGKRLVQAGAQPSANPSKLARALGGPHPEGHARSGAVAVVGDYLAEQYHALGAGDVSLRRGLDPVHPTRVATRRLRSTLRVFAALFDPAASEALDDELAWYAGLLGAVRDRQVQRIRFADAIAALPPELVLGPVAAHIEQRLLSEQLHHGQQLMDALTSDRYRALLSTVATWATTPPFTPAADGDAGLLLPYVKKAGRKAARRLRAALGPHGGDEALHRARKAAKRAGYAAELATPCLGTKAAKTAITTYKAAQEVLGEHHDSVVAADLLRVLGAQAGTTPGQNGFTYGLLYAREEHAAQHARYAAATLSL